MTRMHESCLVTIQPDITPAGLRRLSLALLDKLWPGHAGGVHILFGKRVIEGFAPICVEVMRRKQPLTVRVRRNGINLTIEPEESMS